MEHPKRWHRKGNARLHSHHNTRHQAGVIDSEGNQTKMLQVVEKSGGTKITYKISKNKYANYVPLDNPLKNKCLHWGC